MSAPVTAHLPRLARRPPSGRGVHRRHHRRRERGTRPTPKWPHAHHQLQHRALRHVSCAASKAASRAACTLTGARLGIPDVVIVIGRISADALPVDDGGSGEHGPRGPTRAQSPPRAPIKLRCHQACPVAPSCAPTSTTATAAVSTARSAGEGLAAEMEREDT